MQVTIQQFPTDIEAIVKTCVDEVQFDIRKQLVTLYIRDVESGDIRMESYSCCVDVVVIDEQRL